MVNRSNHPVQRQRVHRQYPFGVALIDYPNDLTSYDLTSCDLTSDDIALDDIASTM